MAEELEDNEIPITGVSNVENPDGQLASIIQRNIHTTEHPGKKNLYIRTLNKPKVKKPRTYSELMKIINTKLNKSSPTNSNFTETSKE